MLEFRGILSTLYWHLSSAFSFNLATVNTNTVYVSKNIKETIDYYAFRVFKVSQWQHEPHLHSCLDMSLGFP